MRFSFKNLENYKFNLFQYKINYYSANLRYHRKRHLNPDGYKCPVCQESFVNQQSLRKHHIRQHLEADLGSFKFVNYVQMPPKF